MAGQPAHRRFQRLQGLGGARTGLIVLQSAQPLGDPGLALADLSDRSLEMGGDGDLVALGALKPFHGAATDSSTPPIASEARFSAASIRSVSRSSAAAIRPVSSPDGAAPHSEAERLRGGGSRHRRGWDGPRNRPERPLLRGSRPPGSSGSTTRQGHARASRKVLGRFAGFGVDPLDAPGRAHMTELSLQGRLGTLTTNFGGVNATLTLNIASSRNACGWRPTAFPRNKCCGPTGLTKR